MLIIMVYVYLFYMCMHMYTLYIFGIGKGVGKWDEVLSITRLSGLASALWTLQKLPELPQESCLA